jgi:hypothetical protein
MKSVGMTATPQPSARASNQLPRFTVKVGLRLDMIRRVHGNTLRFATIPTGDRVQGLKSHRSNTTRTLRVAAPEVKTEIAVCNDFPRLPGRFGALSPPMGDVDGAQASTAARRRISHPSAREPFHTCRLF